MSMTRWWKAACLLLVAGATVSGAGLLGGGGTQAVEPRPQDPGKPAADMPVAAATKGPFRLVANDLGTVEASKKEDLQSRLGVPSRIIWLVPEGTMVKKGDLICELDSGALRDQLSHQKVVTQQTEASYQQAKLSREVAELAVKEYEEGIALSESALVRGEVKLNESAFERAGQRLDRMRRAREKLNALQARQEPGSIGEILAEVDLEDRFDSAEQGLARHRFSVEQAQARLNQFENYTKPKNIRVLRIEREKALSEELAKEQALKLEQQNQSNLERQIRACKLSAGIDGMVVYANPPKQEGQRQALPIREGGEVRPRQIIVRVLSLDAPMRFLAKIGEAMADRLKSGQKAKVRVDAFPNETFTGVVTSIAPLPDPQSIFARDLKVYSTWIELENPNKSMRPGMTGRAEVTIVEREDVLTVPTDAVQSQQGKHKVAVKRPDGSFTWREVVVGEVDPGSKRAEIKQGLEAGEQVATDLPQLLARGIQSLPHRLGHL